MITEENAIDGTEVIFDGVRKTVIQGKSYQDPELGLMIKTAAFPGGMPSEKFELASPPDTIDIQQINKQVSFEVAILDKKEPVKLTADLIRAESKALTDLKISGMFDDTGYEAVKKAKLKAVKTRTAIEKKETDMLKTIKARHKDELKDVTDYTSELYAACREVEKDLQDKMTLIDDCRTAAKEKEAADYKAKTEGREKKMFETGLTWNGEAFVGYGRSYGKEFLYNLSEVSFFELVGDLEGLKMEQDVTGKITAPTGMSAVVETYGVGSVSFSDTKPAILFTNAVYDRTLPDGTRIILTKGESDGEANFLIKNDEVRKSGIFVQVIK